MYIPPYDFPRHAVVKQRLMYFLTACMSAAETLTEALPVSRAARDSCQQTNEPSQAAARGERSMQYILHAHRAHHDSIRTSLLRL